MRDLLEKERRGQNTIWKCPYKTGERGEFCAEPRELPKDTKRAVRCHKCKRVYIVHPAYMKAVVEEEEHACNDFAGNVDDPNLYCAGKWPNSFVPEWQRAPVLE